MTRRLPLLALALLSACQGGDLVLARAEQDSSGENCPDGDGDDEEGGDEECEEPRDLVAGDTCNPAEDRCTGGSICVANGPKTTEVRSTIFTPSRIAGFFALVICVRKPPS